MPRQEGKQEPQTHTAQLQGDVMLVNWPQVKTITLHKAPWD